MEFLGVLAVPFLISLILCSISYLALFGVVASVAGLREIDVDTRPLLTALFFVIDKLKALLYVLIMWVARLLFSAGLCYLYVQGVSCLYRVVDEFRDPYKTWLRFGFVVLCAIGLPALGGMLCGVWIASAPHSEDYCARAQSLQPRNPINGVSLVIC